MITMNGIPPSHRWVEAVSPGLLFGDTVEFRLHTDEWVDIAKTASAVAKKSREYVGFRRFVYDPEEGKKYMDPGWVYFRGVKIDSKDIMSGKAVIDNPEFGIACTDILKGNVRNNGWDAVVFFPKHGKTYPLEDSDVFIGGVES